MQRTVKLPVNNRHPRLVLVAPVDLVERDTVSELLHRSFDSEPQEREGVVALLEIEVSLMRELVGKRLVGSALRAGGLKSAPKAQLGLEGHKTAP